VVWVEDLGSRRGTWVEGKKITAKTRLMPGNNLKLGQTILQIEIPAAMAAEEIEEGNNCVWLGNGGANCRPTSCFGGEGR
jgi:pSer/pThr/pTyr-binding forkhead associated (FHA) protein